MAAGQGFKNFNTGDVLTASDVNGYLMQGVWVFASAAARDSAVTSPQEGNTCYLKDTDVIQVYSGSSWVTKSGASPLTTKGDLYTYSTTDARLAVGTNGQALLADSTAATGLKWGTVATTKTFSLLNSGGTALTGAATITYNISGTYDQIFVIIETASSANASSLISVRVNGDSANYRQFGGNIYFPTTYGTSTTGTNISTNTASSISISDMSSSASAYVAGGVRLDGCAGTGFKPYIAVGASLASGGNNQSHYYTMGYAPTTSVVSSVSVLSSSGNFDGGTLWVWGAA